MEGSNIGFFKGKLLQLAKDIAQMGICGQVFGRGDRPPELELYFANGAVGICTYVSADVDGGFDRFLLVVETTLDGTNLQPDLRQVLCDRFNGTTMGGMAYVTDGGAVCYRGTLPEALVPVPRDTLGVFVKTYETYLFNLVDMLELLEEDGHD